MRFDNQLMAPVALALLTALVVSFLMTPVVKSFAYKVGAIDVPKDERRMHHKPIPRLGGLAIFAGFMASILLFVDIRLNPQMQSILLGAVIIVVLGVVDDIMALPAKLKFVIQIAAALIPALNGVSIQALSNPNIFSPNAYWVLNWLSVPITVLWIVGITNAVNLIDGLDGLANGVSAISAATVLVIALICSEAQVAVVMAALVGACVGFLPYNLNPAKMFMGDTGATFLGFILSTMSIQGLFKFYAVISFAVPFLILGLPIFDTAFAMIRRMAHGQSPMHADRGHIHHRLIDMGLNQKQAVATLYVISGILGLSAVVLTTGGEAIALENNFYTDENLSDKYYLAKYFGKKIEPIIGSCMRKLIKICTSYNVLNNNYLISDELKKDFSYIIIFQLLRGKHTFEYGFKLAPVIAKDMEKEIIQEFGNVQLSMLDHVIEEVCQKKIVKNMA